MECCHCGRKLYRFYVPEDWNGKDDIKSGMYTGEWKPVYTKNKQTGEVECKQCYENLVVSLLKRSEELDKNE
jgi:hypothetical protein